MPSNNGANVYLWKEGTDVDGEEELHGEVLKAEHSELAEMR